MAGVKVSQGTLIAVGVGVAVLVAAWVYARGVKSAAGAVGEAAVGAVDGLVGGVGSAVGDMFGVPRTNMTECEKAKAAGHTWDASFACPAGEFIGWWWKK